MNEQGSKEGSGGNSDDNADADADADHDNDNDDDENGDDVGLGAAGFAEAGLTPEAMAEIQQQMKSLFGESMAGDVKFKMLSLNEVANALGTDDLLGDGDDEDEEEGESGEDADDLGWSEDDGDE